MSDYEVSAISETPILDIFPYSVDEDEPAETVKEDNSIAEEEEEQTEELPYNPEEE
jgi:tRNA (Thr-GGU) A37 N-methylase